jgi:hypothetical protein
MARLFPERRENDDALIAFILDVFDSGNAALFEEQFGLSDRDIAILERRFRHQNTYEAIGVLYGLTKERVRQVLLELYARFRHPSHRLLWDRNCTTPHAPDPLSTLREIPLDRTLLSVRARKALYGLGIRHVSDLIGKTRGCFTGKVDRTAMAEIEREMAEYGLQFQRGDGLRKNHTIVLREENSVET